MTNATATPEPKSTQLVQTLAANEWGQITNLEPHAQYFVIRRPTAEMTKEKGREFTTNVKHFLHEQRIVTEKQMQEFNEKYAEPAKAKANEIRSTVETRFDQIAKEVEARVADLETTLHEKAPAVFKNRNTNAPAAGGAETPGEMPMGEHNDARPRSGSSGAAGSSGASGVKKNYTKKNE